jgi:hypothetical protein
VGRSVIDLTGRVFGRCTVIERDENIKSGNLQWICRCECGNVCTVLGNSLKNGNTKSCGCLHKELIGNRKRLAPFKSSYNKLQNRAQKYKIHSTLTYEEFLEFTQYNKCHYCHNTLNWKPFCSQSYNIDRKDNNQGYTKENCVQCCKDCNWDKNQFFTYKQWYAMTEPYRKGELTHG